MILWDGRGGEGAGRCEDGNGEMVGEIHGGVHRLEDKELNLRETREGEPSLIAVRGMDERRGDKAFAPALYRTQGSAITCVLAAGPSTWSELALPPNTSLPSPLPATAAAPHQHPLPCCSALTNQLSNLTCEASGWSTKAQF
ncbi:hypothetical protein EYF80_009539 [Xyrichtys novacula]|uniref:Uncharacterized protein n=1 Tax=Xyrichtys novacula TaxID=13765 RepID=A0AAV1GLL5_XYRNO|nr:hypothetical protein EYF80_009539 [Xyrichtys novacula]